MVRQLRDYGYDGQWGLEPTYQEYLEHLWEMMDEIYRVLKPTGTVWVNLGDTYARGTRAKYGINNNLRNDNVSSIEPETKPNYDGLNKCLLLLPHRFALGCIERNWIVRNDIVWAKKNGMPESIIDRFSKKHEYFFFMVKSEKYFFDLESVKDKLKDSSLERYKYEFSGNKQDAYRTKIGNPEGFMTANGKNPGDVADFWDIPTKPSKEKHYAAYNDMLLKKPILAGCPEFVCKKCGTPRMVEKKPILFDEKDRELVEYDKSKPYSIQERSGLIEARDLPPLNEIKEYLRKWKGNLTIEQIEKTMDSQAPHHWFSGESYPTKEDWLKIKELLGFDDTYDKQMTTIKYKPSEKGETEYTTTLSDCGCNAGFEGGLVYDPFMGTGSTAEVCLRTKRNFIGSEMSEEYVKIAEKRLLPFLIQPTMF